MGVGGHSGLPSRPHLGTPKVLAAAGVPWGTLPPHRLEPAACSEEWAGASRPQLGPEPLRASHGPGRRRRTPYFLPLPSARAQDGLGVVVGAGGGDRGPAQGTSFPRPHILLFTPRPLRGRCHDDGAHAPAQSQAACLLRRGSKDRRILSATSSQLRIPCRYPLGPRGLTGQAVTANAVEVPWSPPLALDHPDLGENTEGGYPGSSAGGSS